MTGVLTSRTNPRVKLLRAAFEGRRRLAENAVAIEGPHLIAEALRSSLPLLSVFVREDAQPILDELELPQGLEVLVLSRDAFDHAVVTENSQGVAALMVPHESSLPSGRDGLLIVLEAIQDPGNMGTLVRSAEAFGAAGVLAMPGTVDPWNQKAIRASAGSVFRVPVVACTQEMLRQLQTEGVRLIAAVARDGVAPEEATMSGGCAVMIGNEGAGLSEQLVRMADARITIPCPGAVESLNAAVAGSLLLYAASLQRAGGR
jgi:TrmH family RNA methyltransferase